MGIFDFFGKKKQGGPAAEKKGAEPRPEDLIGEVEGFFRKANAAVIKIKKGPLKVGDRIWIHGHTTDLKLAVESMQIDRKPIQEAQKGQSIGLGVKKRCRRGDLVYKLLA